MITFKEWLHINESKLLDLDSFNEEKIRNYIKENEDILNYLNPSDFIGKGQFLTFIYIPILKKLYTDPNFLHDDMIYANKKDIIKQLKDIGLKDQIPEIMSRRRRHFIEGRIAYKYEATTGDKLNYIGLYKYPKEESLVPLLTELKKQNFINDLFIVISPYRSPQIAKDKIKNIKTKESNPIIAKISELMGRLHAGDIVARQEAYKELESLAKENPDNQQLQNVFNTISLRMKRLFNIPNFSKPTFSTTKSEFGPGSGLEKYWGSNPEDLAKAKQNLISQGRIKFNPLTQKYESKLY